MRGNYIRECSKCYGWFSIYNPIEEKVFRKCSQCGESMKLHFESRDNFKPMALGKELEATECIATRTRG